MRRATKLWIVGMVVAALAVPAAPVAAQAELSCPSELEKSELRDADHFNDSAEINVVLGDEAERLFICRYFALGDPNAPVVVVRWRELPGGACYQAAPAPKDPDFQWHEIAGSERAVFATFLANGHVSIGSLSGLAGQLFAAASARAAPCGASTTGGEEPVPDPTPAVTANACDDVSDASTEAFDPCGGLSAGGPTTTNESSSDSGALLAIGGGLLLAGAGVVGLRGRGSIAAGPASDVLVSGAEAIQILLREGWISRVGTRNGVAVYEAAGELTRFADSPTFRPRFRGPDGARLHDLGAIAFEADAGGRFTSATITVAPTPEPVAPPTPQPDQPSAPGPVPEMQSPRESPPVAPPPIAETPPMVAPPVPEAPPVVAPPPVVPGPPRVAPPPVAGATPADAGSSQRERLRQRIERSQAESLMHRRRARVAGRLESGAEWIGWGADRSLDVLAALTGSAGAVIKSGYDLIKGVGKGVGEGVASGDIVRGDYRSVARGAAEGGWDALTGMALDKINPLGLQEAAGFRDAVANSIADYSVTDPIKSAIKQTVGLQDAGDFDPLQKLMLRGSG